MLLLLLQQLTGSAAAVAAGAAPGRRPNIIMALGDDTGWHGVGWHQSSE
eukprot:COSAG06_NODE_35930_length_453_cov_32.056497_1_plen_48_part_10